MNKSSIEWTDYTSNPLQAYADGRRGWFCEKVSPGCAHCYSATLNMRSGRGNGLDFLPANRDRNLRRLNTPELAEWSRKRRNGEPLYKGRCFAFDMTDLFGEWVSDDDLDTIFAAMAKAPNLAFQILTKRPERMRDYLRPAVKQATLDGPALPVEEEGITFTDLGPAGHRILHKMAMLDLENRGPFPRLATWPLPNVWLGVTVENQRWADHRIPILLDTPAAVRFISAEPLLGPIVIDGLWPDYNLRVDGRELKRDYKREHCIDWVIVGGESGPKHRPFDPDWARDVVRQCRAAGVAAFVKQLGGNRPGNALEDLPPDLRVREFPQ